MSDTAAVKTCPKCGAPIPAEAPQGLCPKCLLEQASAPTEAGKGESSRPVPPPLKDVAAAFPSLEILELIGQGGMGFVFKARQPRLDRFVALKILPQSLASDPAFADRFAREGRLLARLNHPNIVTVHDFGQANGFFYLLMEFVDGVNLRQAMRAGRFTPEQALAVVPKICEALQFAHNEGVLHRDIKPENILLDSKGRLKIADFGIAKLIGEPHADAKLTASGGTLGTPHYMAPEQIENPSAVDHRADIYSLGVVFYEMLTGELPLGKFQPPSRKVQVDVRLDDVVLHALEKEPARRYQQASEVKTAVDTITSTPSPTLRENQLAGANAVAPQKPDRFWRRFAIAVALSILALIIIPILLYFLALAAPHIQRAQVVRPETASIQPPATRENPTARILGTVTDAKTGAPLVGATVADRLVRELIIAQQTTTDAGGHFEMQIQIYEPHHLIVSASGYETNISNLAPPLFTNKTLQRVEIQLEPLRQQKESDVVPVPKLVLETEKFERFNPEPGQLSWGFKAFIPPDSLATFLFVQWSNGVPQIDPGFSRYFKVGKAGGVDVPYCSISCYREAHSPEFSRLSEADRIQSLSGWGYPVSAGASNAVHWNVSLGASETAGALRVMPLYHRVPTALPQSVESGHQLRFALIEFETPANAPGNGWSGVDLRVFLEPLRLPAIRMLPNEKDMTNHIVGRGLIGTTDEATNMIKARPLSAAATPNSPELKAELQKALQDLQELRLKYTDTHPSVMALKQRIAKLENERRMSIPPP